MRSMMIAATGMLAQQLNVEVISNNIANLNTTGFKRQRAEFQDLLYQNIRQPGSTAADNGAIVPTGIQVGLGVKTAAVYRINEQGNINITENNLDLSINGRGFFQIELPDGTTGYTRAGSFQLNADGTIVTVDGYTVQPAISVPEDTLELTINSSGEVLARVQGQTDLSNLGQFQMASFANPAGLEAIGDNLFIETPASGSATTGTPNQAGFGALRQGSLETANVNIVNEISALITAQRAYEMNSRVIRASDDMMSTLSQLR